MPIDKHTTVFSLHDKGSNVTMTVEVADDPALPPRLNLSPAGKEDVSIPVTIDELSEAVSSLVRNHAVPLALDPPPAS